MNYKSIVYGNIALIQVECPQCKNWQFECEICDCGYVLKNNKEKTEQPIEYRVELPTWRDRVKDSIKKQIFERDDYICQYCGVWCYDSFIQNKKSVTIEHLIPVIMGGNNKIENLITSCRECNLLKGSKSFKTIDDAREYIKKQKMD